VYARYDICLRAAEESDEASRADFFAGGIISSNHAYGALVRNELPIQSIESGAAWRCDFRPLFSRMGLACVDHWEDMRDHFKTFNLSYSVNSPELFQQEEESQEQLVVDLALSSMAFSAKSVSAPAVLTQMEEVSLATKALTLDDELPEIRPGFLHPRRKLGINHYPDASKNEDAVTQPKQETEFSTPLGVRLLLREWEVGTDVESYAYHDPYNTEGGDLVYPPSQQRSLPTAPVLMQKTTTSSQRPPLVVTGSAPRPSPTRVAHRPWEMSGTQPQGVTLIPHGNYPEPSQGLMTSTQVLPGPHGGRPAPPNKKLVKKRLGGF
jgi:hypothetical protein